jgi:hypothetical protein
LFDVTNLAACPPSDILGHVFDVLNSIVPFPIDVLWYVLELLYLFASIASSVFWKALDVLGSVTEIILDVVLGVLELVLCKMVSDQSAQIEIFDLPTFSPSCIRRAPPSTPAAAPRTVLRTW